MDNHERIALLQKHLGNAPAVFGLRNQGKLDTVAQMRAEGRSWVEVGEAIGWESEAVKRFYAMETAEYIEPHSGIGGTYAKCCGHYVCSSECKAILYHGPGHQSKTHCTVEGPHEIHAAAYGSHQQYMEWRGDEGITGYFDEPRELDDE